MPVFVSECVYAYGRKHRYTHARSCMWRSEHQPRCQYSPSNLSWEGLSFPAVCSWLVVPQFLSTSPILLELQTFTTASRLCIHSLDLNLGPHTCIGRVKHLPRPCVLFLTLSNTLFDHRGRLRLTFTLIPPLEGGIIVVDPLHHKYVLLSLCSAQVM